MFDGPNAFQNMMQTAVKLKGEQMKSQRTKFDKYPTFLQNSMFHPEPLIVLRKLPVSQRLSEALNKKEEGNAFYREHKYWEAINKYEEALGLFRWLVNSSDDWKKKGINDKDITYHEEIGEGNEQKEVVQLLITCINNLATVQFKTEQWDTCKECCKAALELDPDNVKALYRRAQVYLQNPGAGQYETSQALKDLKHANSVDPTHGPVRKRLKQLKVEIKEQNAIDKKTYTGMFNRGSVYKDAKPYVAPSEEEMKRKATAGETIGKIPFDDMTEDQKEEYMKASEHRYRKELAGIRRLIKKYEEEGKEEEAQELRDTLRKAETELEERKKKMMQDVDFTHPTPEMIEDAKKKGIDLTDPVVQGFLQELQERKNRGESLEDIESDYNDSDQDGNIPNNMARKGFKNRPIQPSFWELHAQKIIIVLAIAIVLWRLHSMGVLDLIQGLGSNKDDDYVWGSDDEW